MEYFAGSYDVIVIGAGHAGIEACLAAARLGVKNAVFTINLDWVGNMPCNPSSPLSYETSPIYTLPPRKVPVAIITALALKSASSFVLTCHSPFSKR